ncbi:M20/M25/M40 family metallo-hydrolase [Thermosediminibacter litoriperuensis]|uniref:Arginine utilization protein RocB n=1 Tax=Thermosediminibacter litoriperuensis TaxID=291989 RepID=A0A5S5B137_9FIRM|nr:M20/M25/M40 family metallo-hydrolase [Thermosediminibacter litoriperuensis]TYP58823.1 arginine utilization protein RocB [Thermosediminibacter litoriperuensis]
MLERELIRQLTVELTRIKSIVGTPGEIRVAEKIYDFLKGLDYYAKHSDYLMLSDLKEDALGRKNVIALLKGEKGNSRRTVILIGHIDTVGVEDYGNIREYATDPERLKAVLRQKELDEDTLKDLESGDWLFGRGIFDMKAGVATHMALMKKLSENAGQLEGNVVFLAVPDEEGNSSGMLSAVDELVRLAESHDLEYMAAVDTDYMAPRFPGDDRKYIYIGTVGKILPCFYIYGKETHVGQAFEGLDANLLAAEILKEVDLAFDLCDVVENEASIPPISLSQRDLKSRYSVQTVNEAYLYFNYSTHSSQPDEVLAKLKAKAERAFKSVLDKLNDEYRRYCRAAGMPYRELPWEVQVLTFEELYAAVRAEKGHSIDEYLKKLKEELLREKPDDRIYSLQVVRELHRQWSNKNPAVILFFAPPYYPHIYVKGENEKERKLLAAVNEAVAGADARFPYRFEIKKFYPYISDLSYFSVSEKVEAISALVNNMPGWNEIYSLPIESIKKLNVPVVNIGPYGKDAHKFTERVNISYSFEVMPEILERTVKLLLEG